MPKGPKDGSDAADRTLQNLAAGGFGGACLCIVGAPFDVVKVRQQHSGNLASSTVLRDIMRSEGVRGLWRGVLPPLIASVPQFAIIFASFDASRRFVARSTERSESDLAVTAAAGALVAVPTTFLYTPIDRVKCLLQTDGQRIAQGRSPKYHGTLDCAQRVWRAGGVPSLFRGFGMTLARDVPAWATYFAVYAFAKGTLSASSATLDGRAELSPLASLAAGACAGASTWAVCIPMDTVKTTFQTRDFHRTYAHAVRSVARRGALFAGFWTIVLGGVPRDAACLFGVELAQRAMTVLVTS